MSTAVFPALAGLGWGVTRAPLWKTRQQEAISGKRTRIADWSFPRWQWGLTYDFLRQAGANQQAATFQGLTYAEFASLAGFFNQRQGMFDTFLYQDADDNASPTDQLLGTGDSATLAFQLVRPFGGFIEPIYAPNVVANVKVNGVVKNPGTDYTVSSWGSAAPGVVTFTVAPGAGLSVTATFSFYFPCTFTEDRLDFEKFMVALYQAKKVVFESVK